MVEDPGNLAVEVDVDADAYREEVEAAKRDLEELRHALDSANAALDRLQDRDTIELDVSVSTIADTADHGG